MLLWMIPRMGKVLSLLGCTGIGAIFIGQAILLRHIIKFTLVPTCNIVSPQSKESNEKLITEMTNGTLFNSSEEKIHDCMEVYQKGGLKSDVYTIYTPDGRNVSVFCDMDTAGGGWIVFQRRQDGSVVFNHTWDVYKHGFGDLRGEFWLGNDVISSLTSTGSFVLRVDLWDFDNITVYAEYQNFSINDESDNYRLNLGTYNGTSGDEETGLGLSTHDQMQFSTKDRDNDIHTGLHCSTFAGGNGGYWFKDCSSTCLNCVYYHSAMLWYDSMHYASFRQWHSLRRTEMKFRPKI